MQSIRIHRALVRLGGVREKARFESICVMSNTVGWLRLTISLSGCPLLAGADVPTGRLDWAIEGSAYFLPSQNQLDKDAGKLNERLRA